MSNMKLKEIKPGMVVHCKNDEEKKALLEEAERLEYLWFPDMAKPTEKLPVGNTIHFGDGSEIIYSVQYKNITYSDQIGKGVIEFSDLIESEMTAKEVLSILAEIKRKCGKEFETCHKCPLDRINAGSNGDLCDLENMVDTDKVIRICQQWKADHEKKEPEVEWYWQGRIFKVKEDGCYYQIKDGTGFYDTGCEYRENAEDYMSDELKEYCKKHEGNYIATVEHICRVKAVN